MPIRPEKSRSQCPYALKGQKLLAQGIALGFRTNTKCRPERAKALKIPPFCNISVKVLDLHQEIGAFCNFSPKKFVCEHRKLYLCIGIKKEG